jgi:hypothetical protein
LIGSFIDQDGCSAIIYAAAFGHIGVVKSLLNDPRIDLSQVRTIMGISMYDYTSDVIYNRTVHEQFMSVVADGISMKAIRCIKIIS